MEYKGQRTGFTFADLTEISAAINRMDGDPATRRYTKEMTESVTQKRHRWTDPLFGVLEEWQDIKRHLVEHKALGQAGVKDIVSFWKPIIRQRTRWPRMHVILRLALALAPGSCDVERLFSLLNRINRHDRRRLTMHSLEMLLVVARDAAPWLEYNYEEVVKKYREKRRVRKLRAPRRDKGKKRKRQSDSDSDSPAYCSDPDSQSSGGDVSSVDTSGTDYSSSSDGQCDTSSEESSDAE